jgi:hypothetical protein
MVAPQTLLRKAEGRKVKAAPRWVLSKARAREKPGPCVEGELKGARLDD